MYYAVHTGKTPGIYTTWEECSAQVKGFSGAKYKKFTNLQEAEEFAQVKASITIIDLSSRSGRSTKKSTSKKTLKTKSFIEDPRVISQDNINVDLDTIVFTDGSSLNNGRKGSRAGYGVYSSKLDIKVSARLDGNQTNNRAELKAIQVALGYLSADDQESQSQSVIVSDSGYSIKCVTLWGDAWKKKGWIRRGGIKNKELIMDIHSKLLTTHNHVKLCHVNSHTGDDDFLSEGNAMADELANKGAEIEA